MVGSRPKIPIKITAIKRRRINEAVSQQIREAIFNGLLVTGHKLPPERELARRFQTSRIALREALRSLEKEGMITIKRGFGGGAFVADFDHALRALTDSLQIVVKLGEAKPACLSEVRSLLEPQIARLATLRASPVELAALESVVLTQEKELENGELSRILDMEFHSRLADAARNPVLKIVVHAVNQSLRDAILRSKLTRDMRTRVVGFHRKIFEAVRCRDAELARSAMAEHVADVQCHLDASEHE